jgi:hypothetical protein
VLRSHQPFIDFKEPYDSVRREALHNILIEFGVPVKLVRVIKMCLIETYSRVHICKYLSDNFPIQNGLKQGDALLSLNLNGAHQLLVYADYINQLEDKDTEKHWNFKLVLVRRLV